MLLLLLLLLLLLPKLKSVNPIQTGLFWSGEGGGGEGEVCPPRNFQNIEEITMKLRGYIVRPKIYLLIWIMWDDDVILRDNYVIVSKRWQSWVRYLGFQNFSKTSENRKNLLKSAKQQWNGAEKI